MAIQSTSRAVKREPVSVFVCSDDPVKQPEDFRVCPQGVQFYSPKAVEEFQVMEFRLALPAQKDPAEEIICSGVVVQCTPAKERNMFRVWIKFLDLSESKSEKIRCAAKSGKHLCPYCENY